MKSKGFDDTFKADNHNWSIVSRTNNWSIVSRANNWSVVSRANNWRIVSRANRMFDWMVRNFISTEANIVLTLLRPHIEYYTQAWFPVS